MADSVLDLVVECRKAVVQQIYLPADGNMPNQGVVEATTDRVGERIAGRQRLETARTDVAIADQEVRERGQPVKGYERGRWWPRLRPD